MLESHGSLTRSILLCLLTVYTKMPKVITSCQIGSISHMGSDLRLGMPIFICKIFTPHVHAQQGVMCSVVVSIYLEHNFCNSSNPIGQFRGSYSHISSVEGVYMHTPLASGPGVFCFFLEPLST